MMLQLQIVENESFDVVECCMELSFLRCRDKELELPVKHLCAKSTRTPSLVLVYFVLGKSIIYDAARPSDRSCGQTFVRKEYNSEQVGGCLRL